MNLINYVSLCSWLDLLRITLLISWGIWKDCIEARTVKIIARAHHSQPKMVHHFLEVFTFGMSIAGIRHVDSWGVTHPLGVSMFGMSIAGIRHVDSWSEDSEHWGINGSYVMWSIVISLFSGILAQFGSLRMFSNLFLVSRTFMFILLNDQKTIYLFFTLIVLTVGGLSRCYIELFDSVI